MKSPAVWIGFFLASFMAALQSALFPQLVLFAYAPFLCLACQHTPFHHALWLAALSGLILDLFSSTPFGVHAIGSTLVVALLYRFRRAIFKDQLLQLCLHTALLSALLGPIELLLFFLFDRRLSFTGQSAFVDFLLMPFVDAIYAFLWFTAPLQLLDWATSQWKLWRFKKYGSA